MAVQLLELEEETAWESLMQFEHVDWNDIVDAEMSGDQDALLLLKKKPEGVKRFRSSGSTSPTSRLSYAQIASPPSQHGVKRLASDRAGLSPISAKRSVCDDRRVQIECTPPTITSGVLESQNTITETPEYEAPFSKANCGVQRRLFTSPKMDQLTPTRSANSEVSASHRLHQRQKQIDFGKNTIGYQRYLQTIPKWKRNLQHPATPDKYKSMSTRAWQGQIRLWRRALHEFDPPTKDEFTPIEASLCEI